MYLYLNVLKVGDSVLAALHACTNSNMIDRFRHVLQNLSKGVFSPPSHIYL